MFNALIVTDLVTAFVFYCLMTIQMGRTLSELRDTPNRHPMATPLPPLPRPVLRLALQILLFPSSLVWPIFFVPPVRRWIAARGSRPDGPASA